MTDPQLTIRRVLERWDYERDGGIGQLAEAITLELDSARPELSGNSGEVSPEPPRDARSVFVWHPVTEPPTAHAHYLVWSEGWGAEVQFFDGEFAGMGFSGSHDPTHWCALPPTPGEEWVLACDESSRPRRQQRRRARATFIRLWTAMTFSERIRRFRNTRDENEEKR